MVGSIRSGLMGGPRLSGIRFRTPRALREIEPGRSSLRELEQQVSVLRVALQRLIEGAGIRSTEGSATAAEARSRRPLGLDYEPTFTTLQSLEEVNTTATSYSLPSARTSAAPRPRCRPWEGSIPARMLTTP